MRFATFEAKLLASLSAIANCPLRAVELKLHSFLEAMAKLRLVQAWWLEQGTEICPACNQLYLYETEYRCLDCDGPICSQCVQMKQTLKIVCPTCLECLDDDVEVF
jgi:hypothetical protein